VATAVKVGSMNNRKYSVTLDKSAAQPQQRKQTCFTIDISGYIDILNEISPTFLCSHMRSRENRRSTNR